MVLNMLGHLVVGYSLVPERTTNLINYVKIYDHKTYFVRWCAITRWG